jgi:hypothetical protein
MAIVEVIEVGKGEGAITVRDRQESTYTRVFQVETDAPRVGPKAVIEAVPVAIGDPYETDTEADAASFARAFQARRISDDGCEWEVIVDYAPYDVTRFEEHPLSVPAEVSWEHVKFQETTYQDIDGVAIMNSAGDPFDPPVTRERSRPVLRVVRNEADFDPSLAHQFADKVNSDTFFGATAGTVKSEPPTGRRQWHPASGFFWVVSYEFQFNEDGWQEKRLDEGFREVVAGDFINILDDNYQPINSPRALNGSGLRLAVGGTEVILTFDLYESISFETAFNLE